ncbi:MAG TPA: hypothetical protein VGR31_10795 [Planctomycetota bacterium]|jgi:hypothetical protein|nr:hypothetical protein [Planctomycetota bacterium]
MTTPAWPSENAPATWKRKAAAKAEPALRRGVRFIDAAVLGLIALVVVLVSMPRLRRFALRENETDAIRALRVLADDALAGPDALRSGDLGGLLAASSTHRVRLEDVEVLDDGRLRRHGYLFSATEVAPGRTVLLAWPWDHGRTGLAAFAIEPGADPVGVANEDGRFSGPDRPPPADLDREDTGWSRITSPAATD